ncbi:type III secretion protein J [Bosea lupini]|uniref:Lipoprotein n=1 Tax=Bosea lupini TaxID=1036779 RepID=A0A1H7ZKU6_9HYPH|nr:type III secretion inner membrane ring lipoprotein SctJ [Bosea lupini]SEM58883.1 type III secretion protein J [Bosea lupini]
MSKARRSRILALLCCAALLTGCKVDLYTNLDEPQANEMVAILLQSGIPAGRSVQKGGRLTVTVEEARFADAVTILSRSGLPRQEFQTLGDVFKKDGLVSSPVQDRARMIFALSQELSRTVAAIDGVLTARVHLVLPENDALRQNLLPSSAAVFIRHDPKIAIDGKLASIKMLIANGVAGLSYDRVSVVVVPAERNAAVLQAAPGGETVSSHTNLPWPAITGAVAGCAVIVGGALLLRRRRYYRLSEGTGER